MIGTSDFIELKTFLMLKVWETYQLYGHDGLVIVGQFVIHRHDDTVCHDGDDDDPVEGRPVDQPRHHLPDGAGRGEQEERGRAPLVGLVLLLLPHPGAVLSSAF